MKEPPAAPRLAAPRADVPALRALVAVARLGTVGRAAAALSRTQPSISARIADLERAWGTRLFRRVPRGMEPTPEGLRLVPLAEAVLRDLEALDRVAGVAVQATDSIRVGAGDALGRRRLPEAIATLVREHPGVDVRIREGPAPALLEALRDGSIDLALVVGGAPRRPVAGIDFEPLLTSEVHVLAPRGGVAAGKRAAPLRSLAGRRLVVLQPGSGFRRHLEAALAAAGVSFRPAVEVGNLSLVRRFVAAGLGVAPVPAVAFGPDDCRGLDRRRLAGIAPVLYERAVRDGTPLAPITRRLLELLHRAPTRGADESAGRE